MSSDKSRLLNFLCGTQGIKMNLDAPKSATFVKMYSGIIARYRRVPLIFNLN